MAFKPSENQPNKIIDTPEIKRPEGIIPAAGQAIGGAAGSAVGAVAGGMIGHPVLGSMAGEVGGAILGRTTGNLEQYLQRRQEEMNPLEKIAVSSIPQFARPYAALALMNKDERANIGKQAFVTGSIETIMSPLATFIGRTGQSMFKGAMQGILGKEVANRGFVSGFKNILNPKYYQGRVPKEIAVKMSKWFEKLTTSTGKSVQSAIENVPQEKRNIPVENITMKISGLFPEGVTIDNLDAPKGQIKTLKNETLKILNFLEKSKETKTDTVDVGDLWEVRKSLDSKINNFSWNPASKKYLYKLRGTLNDEIRNSSEEVAASFGRYSFVKNAEDELGDKFSIEVLNNETYATQPEKFFQSLLKTDKSELTRKLKDLDGILNADDKVIDEVLDLAAAEQVEKGPDATGGLISKVFSGMYNLRVAAANIGKFTQSNAGEVIKTTAQVAKRLSPTIVTEAVVRQESKK